MGGPAAIAAFAYGLPEVGLEPVNLVTGPGNIFVAAAKRALRGTIGIDSEAGTTEILVIADDSADARFIAYDLVSQAEHDEAAASVLVTASEALAAAVELELATVAAQTAHAQRVATALAGQQSAIVLVDDLDAAIDFANFYATEHLEIHTAHPSEDAKRISNAGAIFLGQYSPVSLGDYAAGSNHVLPTGGTARTDLLPTPTNTSNVQPALGGGRVAQGVVCLGLVPMRSSQGVDGEHATCHRQSCVHAAPGYRVTALTVAKKGQATNAAARHGRCVL
jgi:histidinol dehydrogenase